MGRRDVVARFPGSGLACASARDVPAFVDGVLAERQKPEIGPTLDHLWECITCARTYGEYLALATAPQLAALRAARDGGHVPQGLEGLLDVWRVQLGLCNLRDDAEPAAFALGTMGMIHRARNAFEEAEELLRLARRTAPGSSEVAVFCNTELACIALERGRYVSGLARGLKAVKAARGSGDDEARRSAGALVRRGARLIAPQMRKQGLNRGFLESLWAARVQAQGKGARILLLESAREIPLDYLDPPTLDKNQVLRLRIKMTKTALGMLPRDVPCFLCVFLVPAGRVVAAITIGKPERDALALHKGLSIHVTLLDDVPSTDEPGGAGEPVVLPHGSWLLWLTTKNPIA